MLRLIINLDRSIDRWHTISEKFRQIDISVERVSAVDGKTLTPEFINSITAPLDHPLKAGFPWNLTVGEIGCSLSHIKCWKRLLESDEKWALIMEDDLFMSDRAPQYMRTEDWLPDGVDFVHLYGNRHCQARIRKERIRINQEDELVRQIRPTPVGTMAYFISREAASFAVENFQPIASPVDEYLVSPYYEFHKKFPIWRLDPCVVTMSDQESTLGDRIRHFKSPVSVFIRRRLLKIRYKFSNMHCDHKILTFK